MYGTYICWRAGAETATASRYFSRFPRFEGWGRPKADKLSSPAGSLTRNNILRDSRWALHESSTYWHKKAGKPSKERLFASHLVTLKYANSGALTLPMNSCQVCPQGWMQRGQRSYLRAILSSYAQELLLLLVARNVSLGIASVPIEPNRRLLSDWGGNGDAKSKACR
ncbi:uncharacterized protein RCO7_14997 [Rhynchosporium graminicola]|uniref:Uncharacterized protein n=1 Tax=Rhynchosporium graminicola TaxID=2792576 RepID=A0A1E1LEL8_9HELO|nr:uncharacterized protein RCO7_14997 [Rhynchosporium commune]